MKNGSLTSTAIRKRRLLNDRCSLFGFQKLRFRDLRSRKAASLCQSDHIRSQTKPPTINVSGQREEANSYSAVPRFRLTSSWWSSLGRKQGTEICALIQWQVWKIALRAVHGRCPLKKKSREEKWIKDRGNISSNWEQASDCAREAQAIRKVGKNCVCWAKKDPRWIWGYL